MGGVSNGKDAGSPEAGDSGQRSASGGSSEDVRVPDLVERHRKSATLLLKEGLAARAFGELVRASRALPMTPRLASALVAFSLRAGTEAAAIALLSSALASVRGDTRRAVRLQLARVLRRVDQIPRALESLQALVDESPGDRPARRLRDLLARKASPSTAASAEEEAQAAPIVQGRALPNEAPERVPPSVSETLHRLETLEFSSPWAEEEHTADALGPPSAPFSPRAAEPRPEPPVASPAPAPAPAPAPVASVVPGPVAAPHVTVLEMASPWAQEEEEVTSEAEASGLPFALPPPVVSSPRDDLDGAAFSHRRVSLDVTAFLPEEEDTATELPPSPDGAPVAPSVPPLPASLRATVPVPWGADDETGPSRPRVQRQDNPEQTRREAQLIARRAWRELAKFYLARAEEAQDPSSRAEDLTRLAELLENELQDTVEAARVYGQIVELTGDEAALSEQVRLLSQRAEDGDRAVRRVLDEAVQRASTPRARAVALLARGERLLTKGELALAREDFGAVVGLTPQSLPALMGLVRSVPAAERARAAERLRAVLAGLPRRAPGRLEGLRCLAELAGGPLADAQLAHWACTEILADDPGDLQAQDQLLELTRRIGDKAGLARLLRVRLGKEPRGPVARKARIELVATLEAAGERDASLAELRQAVRFEPGHKEAWVLLVERLIELGQKGEAAWAMEHAATATEDDEERLRTWERLARFCRETLGDAARAQVYATRADNLREAIAERSLPPPEPPRSAVPKRESSGSRTSVLMPPPGLLTAPPAVAQDPSAPPPTLLEMPVAPGPPPLPPKAKETAAREAAFKEAVARETAAREAALKEAVAKEAAAKEAAAREAVGKELSAKDAVRAALREPTPAVPSPQEPPFGSEPVESTRVIGWDAPPGKVEPVRRRVRGNTHVGAPPEAPASGEATAVYGKPLPSGPAAPVPATAATSAVTSEGRPAAIERVRERPLDAEAYRELSAFFLSRGDMARSSLMAEVASALRGEKDPMPRPPRRPLTTEERAGLRHPGLRNPSGDLLASVGFALCKLFPTYGRAAGTAEPLRPDSGPGARPALDVLQAVGRLFDVAPPELCLAEEDGPPFTLVHPGAPRVLVGRLAVRQALSEPELRFFAGRTLSCLGPDLLSLRCLKKDQMLRAMVILGSALRGSGELEPEARVVRESLHPRARERALAVLDIAQRDFDAAALAEAARHSANRAGLVACGGPGPAVAALRALKVSEAELIELVRFSASERYLPLRG